MAYILLKGTFVNVESAEGDANIDLDARVNKDQRFDRGENVTTSAETAIGLYRFRRDGFDFLCDSEDVIEIQAVSVCVDYGFAG